MNKTIIILPLMLAVSSCTLLPKIENNAINFEKFKGFKIMDIPREDVNVGAQWQQGFGPTGEAANPENLISTKSYTTIDSKTQFGVEIISNFYKILNLSPIAQNHTSVLLEDIKIVTVKNLTELDLSANTQVLYEAISVGNISIKTDSSYAAEVESALLKKFGNSNISLNSHKLSSKKINANDLFVAYRVVAMGKPTITEKTKRFTEGSIQIDDFIINLNPNAAINCMCGKYAIGNGPTFQEKRQCEIQHPLKVSVENHLLGKTASGGMKKLFDIPWNRTTQDYQNIHTSQHNASYKVEKIQINAVLNSKAVNSCLFIQGSTFYDRSNIKLVTITYPIHPVQKPVASGW
ncbi:hypothetical protein [Acinetobacter haemolyticus]|uniref:hypothetical protein n=1 Tax=Acinetobacter haemolyticus TaxID=29430 RepID=UPI0009494C79|nr:hypothetical protein [Acinetobacter haemolyticus]APR70515.1 hypothetical protein AHTJS_09040 [Acinetobacter haemolyticus]